MDAKERLRRYLEQRRDLGEKELVLDGMSVEEVLRLMGAVGGAPPAPSGEGRARAARRSADPAPADAVAPEAGSHPQDVRNERPLTEAEAAGDWRATLRAAGGESVAKQRKSATGTGSGTGPDPAKDAERAQPRPDEPRGQAGMEASPAPGAATPEAAEGQKAPAPKPLQGGAAIPGIDAPGGLVVGADGGELFGTEIGRLETLDDVAAHVAQCQRCPLYSTAKNPVPGEGDPNADFVCVGEAPGANEDEEGRPFIGAAGQLLTKILAAINLAREDVFICNVLKHRPPGNRNPRPEEVTACSPYLVRQLELLRPKVIVAFGTFAAQTLLNTTTPLGQLRGKVHRYYGTPLIVTYHPAALLRNPAWKRPTWEDVQLARRILDHASGA